MHETRTVSRQQLIEAAEAAGIGEEKAAEIFDRLPATRPPAPERFEERAFGSRLVSVLVGVGSLLVIGAYCWWAAAWLDDMAAGAMVLLTVAVQGLFLGAAVMCQRHRSGELASWFAAIVSFLIPALVYGVLKTLGFEFRNDYESFFPLIDGEWVVMEIAALAGGAALLWRFRYPFVSVPLLLYAYFFVLDMTSRVAPAGSDSLTENMIVGYGVLGLALGTLLDLQGLRRFGLWPHLFGAVPALMLLPVWFDLDWQISTIISGALLLALGAALGRVSLLAIGGAALWIAVTSIAANPLTLVLSGLAAIAAAVWLARPGNPVRLWLDDRRRSVEQATS
jgi:hypothetical protein